MRRMYHGFAAWWARHRVLDDEGQAVVESAIVLPLMTFLILGTIQLTMMQQARLMTEYAAFQACRAGIVWNADKDQMKKAAMIALLPTVGRTDSTTEFAKTWAKMKLALEAGNLLGAVLGGLPGGIGHAADIIDIETLSPSGLSGPEVDFDKVGDDTVRDQTRLTIKLTYLYLMRIPFANWVIHDAWSAAHAGIRYTGPIDRPMIGTQQRNANVARAAAAAKEALKGDFRSAARFALIGVLANNGYYLIPLEATYTMRMQSNPFQDNLDS